MQELLDVMRVETMPGYRLTLEFSNGERRIFDMTPYLNKKPFMPLKQPLLFAKAAVDYGTVVWPGNIDISPDTLYDRSLPVS